MLQEFSCIVDCQGYYHLRIDALQQKMEVIVIDNLMMEQLLKKKGIAFRKEINHFSSSLCLVIVEMKNIQKVPFNSCSIIYIEESEYAVIPNFAAKQLKQKTIKYFNSKQKLVQQLQAEIKILKLKLSTKNSFISHQSILKQYLYKHALRTEDIYYPASILYPLIQMFSQENDWLTNVQHSWLEKNFVDLLKEVFTDSIRKEENYHEIIAYYKMISSLLRRTGDIECIRSVARILSDIRKYPCKSSHKLECYCSVDQFDGSKSIVESAGLLIATKKKLQGKQKIIELTISFPADSKHPIFEHCFINISDMYVLICPATQFRVTKINQYHFKLSFQEDFSEKMQIFLQRKTLRNHQLYFEEGKWYKNKQITEENFRSFEEKLKMEGCTDFNPAYLGQIIKNQLGKRHYARGYTYSKLKMYKKAIQYLSSALRYLTQAQIIIIANYYLAKNYYALKRYEKVIEHLNDSRTKALDNKEYAMFIISSLQYIHLDIQGHLEIKERQQIYNESKKYQKKITNKMDKIRIRVKMDWFQAKYQINKLSVTQYQGYQIYLTQMLGDEHELTIMYMLGCNLFYDKKLIEEVIGIYEKCLRILKEKNNHWKCVEVLQIMGKLLAQNGGENSQKKYQQALYHVKQAYQDNPELYAYKQAQLLEKLGQTEQVPERVLSDIRGVTRQEVLLRERVAFQKGFAKISPPLLFNQL